MIRFSRSEDYAVILVNHLALHYKRRNVPLSEVSKKYNISSLFLRNLALKLRAAGIIRATEGKNGGYTLVKDPKTVTMGEILTLFSTKPMLECCSYGEHKATCDKVDFCPTGRVWRKLNHEFLQKISGLTLSEFMTYEKTR